MKPVGGPFASNNRFARALATSLGIATVDIAGTVTASGVDDGDYTGQIWHFWERCRVAIERREDSALLGVVNQFCRIENLHRLPVEGQNIVLYIAALCRSVCEARLFGIPVRGARDAVSIEAINILNSCGAFDYTPSAANVFNPELVAAETVINLTKNHGLEGGSRVAKALDEALGRDVEVTSSDLLDVAHVVHVSAINDFYINNAPLILSALAAKIRAIAASEDVSVQDKAGLFAAAHWFSRYYLGQPVVANISDADWNIIFACAKLGFANGADTAEIQDIYKFLLRQARFKPASLARLFFAPGADELWSFEEMLREIRLACSSGSNLRIAETKRRAMINELQGILRANSDAKDVEQFVVVQKVLQVAQNLLQHEGGFGSPRERIELLQDVVVPALDSILLINNHMLEQKQFAHVMHALSIYRDLDATGWFDFATIVHAKILPKLRVVIASNRDLRDAEQVARVKQVVEFVKPLLHDSRISDWDKTFLLQQIMLPAVGGFLQRGLTTVERVSGFVARVGRAVEDWLFEEDEGEDDVSVARDDEHEHVHVIVAQILRAITVDIANPEEQQRAFQALIATLNESNEVYVSEGIDSIVWGIVLATARLSIVPRYELGEAKNLREEKRELAVQLLLGILQNPDYAAHLSSERMLQSAVMVLHTARNQAEARERLAAVMQSLRVADKLDEQRQLFLDLHSLLTPSVQAELLNAHTENRVAQVVREIQDGVRNESRSVMYRERTSAAVAEHIATFSFKPFANDADDGRYLRKAVIAVGQNMQPTIKMEVLADVLQHKAGFEDEEANVVFVRSVVQSELATPGWIGAMHEAVIGPTSLVQGSVAKFIYQSIENNDQQNLSSGLAVLTSMYAYWLQKSRLVEEEMHEEGEDVDMSHVKQYLSYCLDLLLSAPEARLIEVLGSGDVVMGERKLNDLRSMDRALHGIDDPSAWRDIQDAMQLFSAAVDGAIRSAAWGMAFSRLGWVVPAVAGEISLGAGKWLVSKIGGFLGLGSWQPMRDLASGAAWGVAWASFTTWVSRSSAQAAYDVHCNLRNSKYGDSWYPQSKGVEARMHDALGVTAEEEVDADVDGDLTLAVGHIQGRQDGWRMWWQNLFACHDSEVNDEERQLLR